MKKIYLYIFSLLMFSLSLAFNSVGAFENTVTSPNTNDSGILTYIIFLVIVLIGGIAIFFFRNKGQK